jgi:hypothetical protein
LSGNISGGGVLQQTIHYVILGGQGVLDIGNGTIALLGGNPLQSITVDEICVGFPPDPKIIGCVYDYKPTGATFSPPITLTLKYDPGKVPAGFDESMLVIAYYDTATSMWTVAPSVVDTVNNTVSAQISHFTLFTVYGADPAATPTPTVAPTPTIAPTPTPTPVSTPPQVSWSIVGAAIGGMIAVLLLAAALLFVLRRR